MASIKNAFLVDASEKEQRMAICRACPHLNRQGFCGTPIVGMDVEHEGKQYRTCGCFMEFKTALQGTACPLGKWGTLNVEQERYNRLGQLLAEIGGSERITRDQATELRTLHRFLISNKPDPGECPSCLIEMLEEARQHLKAEKGKKVKVNKAKA